jgi:RNA polymerase sigma-70 factor (sigma-E family)
VRLRWNHASVRLKILIFPNGCGRLTRRSLRPAGVNEGASCGPPANFFVLGKGGGLVRRVWGVEQLRLEFTEFYLANRDDCLRIVLLSAGDGQLAEDLVAEAFARAWASWRKVRVHPAPVAWVVRTALNANVSWWRRRRREVALPSGADWAAPRPADAGLDNVLVAAVRALPVRQREVVTLRVFFDLDMATTAALLGISPGTVGAHLHRALAALRTKVPSFSEMGE